MFHHFFQRKRNDSRADLYRKISLTFFSVSAIVAVLIFVVSFSWATITLTPAVKPLSDTVQLTIQQEPISISGAVAGFVYQQDLEGAGTFTPSTQSTVQGKAEGVITVVNTSGRAQPMRATTRFLSDSNVLFRSTSFVTAPAHGQIDVPVIADASGDPGDLTKARFSLPALWPEAQKQIYGTSFSTTAGSAQTVRTITPEDITRAEAEVTKKLEEKFLLLLDTEKSKVGVPAVASTFRSEVVKRTADHAAGEQAKEFTVRLTLRFSAALYDEQTFLGLVRQRMTERLSTGYQLIDPKAGDISATITTFDMDKKLATLSLNVHAGKIRTDDLQPYHKKDLAGLSREDIVAYFRGYDDITDVSVQFYPFWVNHAPLLLDHTTIRIQKASE